MEDDIVVDNESEFWRIFAATYISEEASRKRRQVRGFFGIDYISMNAIWKRVGDAALRFHLQPLHLLWTLHFLRVYDTVDRATVFWNTTYKTWSECIWRMIELIIEYVDTVHNANIKDFFHSKFLWKGSMECKSNSSLCILQH
jgi:hypothetical protein